MNLYFARKLFASNPYMRLTHSLGDALGEYKFICPEATLYDLSVQWVDQQILNNNISKKAVLKRIKNNPLEDAKTIATAILSEMAEERPGTDPFDHEGTIPISLPALLWVIQGLTYAADLAVTNGQDSMAHESLSGVVSLLRFSTSPSTQEELVAQLGEERVSELEGVQMGFPIILIPQSGIAYVARRLESALTNLEDERWVFPVEEGPETDQILDNLADQIEELRELNKYYGQSSEPTEGS